MDELSFSMDDIISNIEMIDEGWAHGSFNGKRGMFPITYVEVIEASPSKPSRSAPSNPIPSRASPPVVEEPTDKGVCGRAVYDYTAGDIL